LKYFLFLLSISTILFSSTINSSLLKVHATLVPKLLLMDYDFSKKTSDNLISIVIAYDKVDYSSAKLLKIGIEQKYHNGLKSCQVAVKLIPYSKLSNSKNKVNLYYLFPTNKQNISKLVKKAKLSNTLTFSYITNDLQDGVMISVIVNSKVKPILNLDAIKSSDITLRPVLLEISKIYKKEEI